MHQSVQKYADKRIAVLMGGMSSEREISLRSGHTILSALQSLGLQCVAIDVGRDISARLKQEKTDIAFIALHGRYGEDGCIQGLLEIMGIPYTGSGVRSSAVGMNKITTKKVLSHSGIPVPAHVELALLPEHQHIPAIESSLGFPVVLKAVSEGSSVGVEIISDKNSLSTRLPGFLREYPGAFAEQYVQGREMTIGVLGNAFHQEVFPILELRPKNAFYDFEAKYTKDMTEFIIPAAISASLTQSLQEQAKVAFKSLELQGVARLDLILDAQNRPYFLEANTIPGFTETSDVPAMARAVGMSYPELVLKILDTIEDPL